jgi:hypothetical protein
MTSRFTEIVNWGYHRCCAGGKAAAPGAHSTNDIEPRQFPDRVTLAHPKV